MKKHYLLSRPENRPAAGRWVASLLRALPALLLLGGIGAPWAAWGQTTPTAEPDQPGLRPIGKGYFPVRPGSELLPVPNGNFEDHMNQWPTGGWCVPGPDQISRTVATLTEYLQRVPKPAEIAAEMRITLGEYDYICRKVKQERISSAWFNPARTVPQISLVQDGKAPEGNAYLHVPAGEGSLLRSPDFELRASRPHLLSMWARNNTHIGGGPWFWFDVGLDDIDISYNGIPGTGGEWKRVGIYFRPPGDVRRGHWTLDPGNEGKAYVDLDDIRLQVVSEEEFSTAYAANRAHLPAHDITPRADDGQYLALAIAKLEGKMGVSSRPFLIWAVGSSWTTYLGDGEALRQIILQRFPQAPPIVYKKHVGSGTPYQYARGWVQTEVVAEQPDLVLTYTGGEPEDLELMLENLRRHTTADIIVPSLHFFENDRLDDQTVNAKVWDQIQEVCRKYKAEFVDNRRELAAWLKANNRSHKDLLVDAVHQSELGALLINENIGRHFARHSSPAYDPASLERRISFGEARRAQDSAVTFSAGWEVGEKYVVTEQKDASIKVTFHGTRIDLLGRRVENGGGVRVFIDGKPAGKSPAFFVSFPKAATLNVSHMGDNPRSSGGNRDTGPHGVILGDHIVPQTWTIRMLNDAGDYELISSVTKQDGQGNTRALFTSKSGQIIIDPATWRHPQANRTGDKWTFTVHATGKDQVSFKGGPQEPQFLDTPLVQNLANGTHTLEIRSDGNGPVALEGVYIYQPMMK